MSRFYALLLVLVLVSATAAAGTIPSGWSCTGNCGTDGASGVVGLGPSGNPYEWVSTSGGLGGVGTLTGIGGTNGSVLTSSTFAAGAGDPLSFYFNYVTSDGAQYADYAWVKLVNAGTSTSILLFTARTTPGGDTVPGFGMPAVDPGVTLLPPSTPIIPGGPVWSALDGSSGLCYSTGCGYTGWIGSSYTISVAGNYYLQFGTTNWLDTLWDSGLAIDNVKVAGELIPGQVPEPGTLALLGSGLLGLARTIRRKLAR